jgi:hypothetical protein
MEQAAFTTSHILRVRFPSFSKSNNAVERNSYSNKSYHVGAIFTHRDMTTAINSAPHRSSKASAPVLGVGDKIGEGDSYLVENVLPPELAEVVFDKLMEEVAWNVMHHRGTLAFPIIPIAREDTTQRRPHP